MKEEKYILNNQDSFYLKDIFECGQCFRWNKNLDNSYTGITKYGVINVKQEEEKITFEGKIYKDYDLKDVVEEYFDLELDYSKIKNTLKKIDKYMEESINFGEGIRILNQDFWETIISFIISANNNIPRIKKIINNISEKYGNLIEWRDQKYYTFPTVEQLSKASIEDLRALGLGFRDKRIYRTTKMILNKEFDLKQVSSMENTEKMREE